jgi:hypothetical protein
MAQTAALPDNGPVSYASAQRSTAAARNRDGRVEPTGESERDGDGGSIDPGLWHERWSHRA